jgi:hypothetical protein
MPNSIRILIIFLASVILTVIVNQFHPVSLPLLLPEGKRPGIPKGEWNELRYVDARNASEEFSLPRENPARKAGMDFLDQKRLSS